MRRSRRSGFTLIELMIVVGILAILVAVLTGFLLNAASKGDESKAKYFVTQAIPAAIMKWQGDGGRSSNDFPPSPNLVDGAKYTAGNVSLFDELVTKPEAAGKEAYIASDLYSRGEVGGKPVFLDPWENPYIYRNYTMKRSATGGTRAYTGRRYNANTYDVISLGRDGQLYEVDGNNDDIHNGS